MSFIKFRGERWKHNGSEFGRYVSYRVRRDVRHHVRCLDAGHGIRCHASAGETRRRAEVLPAGR